MLIEINRSKVKTETVKLSFLCIYLLQHKNPLGNNYLFKYQRYKEICTVVRFHCILRLLSIRLL